MNIAEEKEALGNKFLQEIEIVNGLAYEYTGRFSNVISITIPGENIRICFTERNRSEQFNDFIKASPLDRYKIAKNYHQKLRKGL